MVEEEIKNLLVRHFDQHQKCSGRRALPIEARVAQIYDEINQIELQAKVEGVSLTDDDAAEKYGGFDAVVSGALIHVLECSLVTEVSNNAKESIEAIRQLVSAVAAQRVQVARSLLQDRVIPLTVVLLERVRSSACHCIGLTVDFLLRNEEMNKEDLESLLDMSSQALLPRFTDKAQSVRQSAIEASRFFFRRASGQVEQEIDDPDIRQSLQWSLQHDPSVTNRVSALESLPVTLQTVDVILTRVRDVKVKVRVAAVKTLRTKLPDLSKWEAEQCAELVESGWTERCMATKVEVEEAIFDWLKSMNFDLIEFLGRLKVVQFEESCQKVIRILVNATDEFLSNRLSEAELVSFQRRLKEATEKLVLVNQALEVERVFLINARLGGTFAGQRQKEMVVSDILPDVPEICEMFELHASALMKAIADEKDFDVTNRLACVCLRLLSMIQSSDIEEGSRLHLKSTLTEMLESVVMPDDLVEGCVQTLQRIHRVESDFWETILHAVQSLDTQADDGLSDNRSLRILSILCIVFEGSSSRLASSLAAESFAQYITPALTHENDLVREAGVSCFGKLGLYTKAETVLSEFNPTLLKVASDESEKLSIRAQAILGLSDWMMLFADVTTSGEDTSLPNLVDMIPEIMNHEDISLACVAAEVACKHLLSGKIVDGFWMAQLLVFFFDPRLVAAKEGEDDDDDGAKEVGSPVRLQQILTQFFLLYCLRSQTGRNAFTGCVAAALEMANSKEGKKKRGSKVFPIPKMLDFVLATVVEAESSLTELSKKDGTENEVKKGSSPFLLVSIQVAKFLLDRNDTLAVLVQRALAKVIGTANLDLEREDVDDLKVLADLMENLGMSITDGTCLKHLSSMNELLDDVDFSSRSNTLDVEEESLNRAMGKVHISPSRGIPDKENALDDTPQRQSEKRAPAGTPVRHARLSISSAN